MTSLVVCRLTGTNEWVKRRLGFRFVGPRLKVSAEQVACLPNPVPRSMQMTAVKFPGIEVGGWTWRCFSGFRNILSIVRLTTYRLVLHFANPFFFHFYFAEETSERFVEQRTKRPASSMQQSSWGVGDEPLAGLSRSSTRSRCWCWAPIRSRSWSSTLFMRHATSSFSSWRCKKLNWTKETHKITIAALIACSQGFRRLAGHSRRRRVVDRAEDSKLHSRSFEGSGLLASAKRCASRFKTAKHSAQLKQLGRWGGCWRNKRLWGSVHAMRHEKI